MLEILDYFKKYIRPILLKKPTKGDHEKILPDLSENSDNDEYIDMYPVLSLFINNEGNGMSKFYN
jgi:hypothetical protein